MSGSRVLVVEDEELVRLILAEVLADEGYDVVEARTGDEAFGLLDDPDNFHAVVTDIHMPGGRDGLAVGRQARRRNPEIPVVYCTGRPDALAGAGPLGPHDTLVRKPYVPSQIVTLLQSILPT